jgi:RHS repeat-associated protein
MLETASGLLPSRRPSAARPRRPERRAGYGVSRRRGCGLTADPGVDPETGLIYMRARYYDPITSQFLSVDPLLAQTQQPYQYTAGNPSTQPTQQDGHATYIRPVSDRCSAALLGMSLAAPPQRQARQAHGWLTALRTNLETPCRASRYGSPAKFRLFRRCLSRRGRWPREGCFRQRSHEDSASHARQATAANFADPEGN